MPPIPRLELHISVNTVGCASKDCIRVILPGEVLMMRQVVGTACSEPLCPVCAAIAIEDAKLSVRMFLHREEQRVMQERLIAGEEASPPTQPMPGL